MTVSPTVRINVSGARGGQGIQGNPGGDQSTVGMFIDIVGMTIGDGIKKLYTTGYRRLGWGKAAYTQWGAPMANLPASGQGKWWITSNGGAKRWYLDPDGDAYFDMLGAYGDDTNDDYPAFLAMQDFARWRGGYQAGDNYCMGGVFRFRPALYYTSATWELKATVQLFGPSSGQAGGSEANRNWRIRTADCHGIVVNRYNTLNGAIESTPTGGADGSVITGLNIVGSGFSKPALYHGVYCHGRAIVAENNISYFSGDLIRAASGDLGGNVNGMVIRNNRLIQAGRSGYWVQGGDGNAGIIEGNDITNCGDWGFVTRSFLANTHIGDQVARSGTIGVAGRTVASACSYNGAYYQVMDGRDAAASTTVPGTDSTVWGPVSGNGSANYIYPAWTSGMTWKAGGSFLAVGGNAGNPIIGLYLEPDCGPSQTSGLGFLIGGQSYAEGDYPGMGTLFGYLSSTRGFGALTRKLNNSATYQFTTLGGRRIEDGTILQDTHTVNSPLTWRLRHDGSGNLTFDYANIAMAFAVSGPTTAIMAGRSVPQLYKMLLPSVILGSTGNARTLTYAAAVPASGEYARGDIIYNSAPVAGGSPGWICTTGGTAGSTAVFKTMASVAA